VASKTTPAKPAIHLTVPALSEDTPAATTGVSGRVAGGGAGGSFADEVAATVTATVRAAQAVLPNRLPGVLGVAALLVAGAVDPPVALAGGLAYEALRRWGPRPRPV
jgi:hypothetical protein